MKLQVLSRGVALVLAGQMFATSAFAYGSVYIRRNTVIPVVFEDELNIRHNREGDRFYAKVDQSNRDLPAGTRVEGRIVDIQPKRDKRPAYMDVEFTTLILPDGTSEDIRAVPISLDSKAVYRDRDGRLQADPKKVKSEYYVLGGLVGGLIVGGLLKKPFEGAFVGTLAGIILGESAKNSQGNGDVVVKRGSKMGAMFEQDVEVRYDDRYDRYGYDRDRDDRNDRDRDDRYDDRYDRERDDRNNDRYEVPRVSYEGRELRFGRNEEPYRVGDSWMVPLERTAGQLGLTVDRAGNSAIFVEDDDSSLRLELDSRNYRLNGRRGTLTRAVVERNGVLFVPLDVLAATKDRPVYLNGTRVTHNSYN